MSNLVQSTCVFTGMRCVCVLYLNAIYCTCWVNTDLCKHMYELFSYTLAYLCVDVCLYIRSIEVHAVNVYTHV